MPENSSSNRRQDYRVDDVISMKDSPVSTEEYELKKQHISIRSRQDALLRDMIGKDIFAERAPDADSEVIKAVETLDSKLNYLIGMNMLNDANRSELKERPVNLSATGISFISDERYREGDPIELTLMLPVFPPTIIDLIGDVIWSRTRSGGRMAMIGVKFFYRCGEEEETIAKYVFKRDREAIRLKNRHEESISGL